MKNLIKYLLSGFCLIFVSISCFAKSDQIAIELFIDSELEDERPSKGNRIPSAPFVCVIDYENHCITSSIPYEIIAYELWDEDGHAPLVSYNSDYEFVEFISGLSGNYQLRLVTNQRVYVGYLDL